jgi:hypothetical protein
MNQLENIFRRLAEKEAARRARQKQRQRKKTPLKNGPRTERPIIREEILERLISKCRKEDFGCWMWTASKNHCGYGNFNLAGETLAHRVSWLLHVGEIPEGLCVLHKCDVPACINPDHLFVGTHTENMADCISKDRFPSQRITQKDVEFIREHYSSKDDKSGMAVFLSEKFSLHIRTIYDVIERRTWKHLK